MNPIVIGVAIVSAAATLVASVKIIADACTKK